MVLPRKGPDGRECSKPSRSFFQILAPKHPNDRSSIEAMQKIEELKKKVEETEVELGASCSLTNNLKEELAKSSNTVSLRDSEINLLRTEVSDLKRQISELILDLSLVETVTSEVETRHRLEIKDAQAATIEEQKGKILRLGWRLASDSYNLCLKKTAKAYAEVDIDLLDQIEVSDDENGEYEDDKGLDDSPDSKS
ncbi:hypothetical protein F0562_017424 [Nyssa sinensis]|uniref:Uncharacterized protein n=1 Tax=Nyssa sinensis TaxID=561372 RepID=A0A5J4ZIU7_9ASTE|nr:hypothetical protein F0562_017424 [Nyssa sinensis]